MWQIQNLINNHFKMEGDKHCKLGQCIKFISNIYLDLNPKKIYVISYTINITMIFLINFFLNSNNINFMKIIMLRLKYEKLYPKLTTLCFGRSQKPEKGWLYLYDYSLFSPITTIELNWQRFEETCSCTIFHFLNVSIERQWFKA
jgi:hypothetical protein